MSGHLSHQFLWYVCPLVWVVAVSRLQLQVCGMFVSISTTRDIPATTRGGIKLINDEGGVIGEGVFALHRPFVNIFSFRPPSTIGLPTHSQTLVSTHLVMETEEIIIISNSWSCSFHLFDLNICSLSIKQKLFKAKRLQWDFFRRVTKL